MVLSIPIFLLPWGDEHSHGNRSWGGAGVADALRAGVKQGLLRGVPFDGLTDEINTLSFCAQDFLHVKLALNEQKELLLTGNLSLDVWLQIEIFAGLV